MSNTQQLWTKNFILTSLMNFQLTLVFYMLIVVIAAFAIQHLGASTTQAGLISGLFIIGILSGRIVIGSLMNKLRQQTILRIGLIGFIICSGLYFFDYGANFLLVIRFLHGFFLGLISNVLGTFIAQIIPTSRRAEGIGYYSLSSSLGTAVGPFLGVSLSLHSSYYWTFVVSLFISIFVFINSLAIKVPTIPAKKVINTESRMAWISKLLEPKALPIAIIIFIAAICYSSVLSFINFYAKELDLAQAASVFFLFYASAILVSRPFTGKLMDKYGENIVMYPALCILSSSLFLLSITSNAIQFLISAALLGFGFGNIQSITQAIVIKSTTLSRMGYATSTFFIALESGMGFGPLILGIFLNHISYSRMYMMTAIIALLTIILYYYLHGRWQK